MKFIFNKLYSIVLFLMLIQEATAQKNMEKYTLHPLSKTTLEVAKGTHFYYQATVHASVGIEVAYEIDNPKIIGFHHDQIEYKHKEAMQQGMSGADEATKTFVFEAKEKGEATLYIYEVFRGQKEQTFTFKITVK